MNMSDIKKLDTEEIQNKVIELKDSILKAKISKLNQGDFDSNTFNKIKKDVARCLTELNFRNQENK
ncbi:MAG: 50S ribosomal protein L29 [Deltaproteobacteria bacterium TMED126]|nr:50S ribosomal protein L29 [Candidatus Dadabacteria bacterium]NSW97051.1 50S ribosomal protein L29 [Deltaproteobacteria bacterium TMED126]|tara:strand:- start:16694 stop:16891 length:198 start_codon:yes stop_codon:yes gene_type:complete